MIIKIVFTNILFFILFTSFAHAELYKYTDSKGVLHYTDNILSVPEDQRNQINTIEENKSPSRLDSAPTNEKSNQLNLSATDICYLKISGLIVSESDLTELKRMGITPEKFNKFKSKIQQKYGVNDNTVCAFASPYTNDTSPDPRFASPELTYTVFKEALTKGEIKQVSECFSLRSKAKYIKAFTAMGTENLKQMVSNMVPIEHIYTHSDMAKYRIKRNEGGQDITYYIYFLNEFGNWKIEQF